MTHVVFWESQREIFNRRITRTLFSVAAMFDESERGWSKIPRVTTLLLISCI